MIVDDGYQYTHPDLAAGYVAASSYNFNGDTPDPAPGTFLFISLHILTWHYVQT